MSQSVNLLEYQLYHKKCELLLKQPEIRFAGFLDSMGNLIAGGFRNNDGKKYSQTSSYKWKPFGRDGNGHGSCKFV